MTRPHLTAAEREIETQLEAASGTDEAAYLAGYAVCRDAPATIAALLDSLSLDRVAREERETEEEAIFAALLNYADFGEKPADLTRPLAPVVAQLVADANAMALQMGRLRARLRDTAQILLAEVGADGPCDAEDAARRAVAALSLARSELARVKVARDSVAAAEARGAARERERIAAWLRGQMDLAPDDRDTDDGRILANLVAAGAHVVAPAAPVPR
jgi:hypothetical protein